VARAPIARGAERPVNEGRYGMTIRNRLWLSWCAFALWRRMFFIADSFQPPREQGEARTCGYHPQAAAREPLARTASTARVHPGNRWLTHRLKFCRPRSRSWDRGYNQRLLVEGTFATEIQAELTPQIHLNCLKSKGADGPTKTISPFPGAGQAPLRVT